MFGLQPEKTMIRLVFHRIATLPLAAIAALGACDLEAQKPSFEPDPAKVGDTPKPRNDTPKPRNDTPKPRNDTPKPRNGTPIPRKDTPPPASEDLQLDAALPLGLTPSFLPGLVGPREMTRLPASPERPGDIISVDLRGPESHVGTGRVGVVLWRHRVRSDGTWAAIDSVSAGLATESRLSHVVVTALGTTSATRRDLDAKAHGHVALAVRGADGQGVDVAVTTFGRNRFLETRVVARLAPKEQLLQLEATADGGAIVTLRRLDGEIVTRRHDSREAVTSRGTLATTVTAPRLDRPVATGWLARGVVAAAFDAGSAEVDAEITAPGEALVTRLHAGPRHAFDAAISGRCAHTLDPRAPVLIEETAIGGPGASRGAGPELKCMPLDPGDGLARCQEGGGRLALDATRLRPVRNVGMSTPAAVDVMALSCVPSDGGDGIHAVFLRELRVGAPSGWRRAVTAIGHAAPTAAAVSGDRCGAVRIAGEDMRHGAFRVEVPFGECEERLSSGANPGRSGAPLRADGLEPARGMVAPNPRPGSERCTASPGGAALCATRLLGDDRPILAATALPAEGGGALVALTVGGPVQSHLDVETSFGFGAPEAFLVRVDANGGVMGQALPVPAACEGWTRVDERHVAAACARGVLLFEVDAAAAREQARWTLDLGDGAAGTWRCGATLDAGHGPDALPCPHVAVSVGEDSKALVVTAIEEAGPGEAHLHVGRIPLGVRGAARASLERVTTYRDGGSEGRPADEKLALRLAHHRTSGAIWVLARWTDAEGIARAASVLTRIAGEGAARAPVTDFVLRPSAPAAPVVPLGFGVVSVDATGRPVAGLIGLQLDAARGFEDGPTPDDAPARTDADTFVVMPLPGPGAEVTTRWSRPIGASPLAALVRAPGVGLPAAALLRHGPRLLDADGDGVTDLLIDVAPDDRIPLGARRVWVAAGRGDGGFHPLVAAPPDAELGLRGGEGELAYRPLFATAFHLFSTRDGGDEDARLAGR